MSTTATMSAPPDAKRKHKIVPQEEWIATRKGLLKREKEATRLLDQLSAERRQLPWVKIEKDYVFDGPSGKVTLENLFAGRNQLVIYHFMFAPDWQEGCPSCSFVSDHFDGTLPHLAARAVTLVAVSRAPLAKLEAFKKRMGWHFNWVSSFGGDFNADFHVSFTQEEKVEGKVNYNYTMQEFPSSEGPGLSVFYKDANGDVFHTYSTYGRGLEQLLGTYRILDLAPKGRDEDDLDFSMAWVRYHDRYDTNEFADADKPYWPETVSPSSAACGCGSAEARA
ncbi:MAG: thioredoxin family protein [Prosthecobacter sp.]|nr:thioredoxin family protein [Prosthecobacter sp.]